VLGSAHGQANLDIDRLCGLLLCLAVMDSPRLWGGHMNVSQ
jgi:hypothetical protein